MTVEQAFKDLRNFLVRKGHEAEPLTLTQVTMLAGKELERNQEHEAIDFDNSDEEYENWIANQW